MKKDINDQGKSLLRVKWRAGKGRCLVASRDINPLELIMFDAAIVTGPQVSFFIVIAIILNHKHVNAMLILTIILISHFRS